MEAVARSGGGSKVYRPFEADFVGVARDSVRKRREFRELRQCNNREVEKKKLINEARRRTAAGDRWTLQRLPSWHGYPRANPDLTS